jgi:hypothetical protein
MAVVDRRARPAASTLIRNTVRRARLLRARSEFLRVWARENAFNFLLADLGLGLTFTRIASDAAVGSEKRTRNQANAKKVYDAMSRFSPHLSLTKDEREGIEVDLDELKLALERLGEVFV